MRTAAKLMTAEELLVMPKVDRLYELLEGELRMMAPAGGDHGIIEMTLGAMLVAFVRQHRLGRVVGGDTGFLIRRNPDTVLSPDVGFISHERLAGNERPQGYFEVAPDLAVEVVSPSDRLYEVDENVQTWLRAGTQVVWVVNPKARTVTVHSGADRPVIMREADRLDGGAALPGLSVEVRDVFA